jgi:hypothetical protein
MMSSPLQEVRCASLPVAALGALAGVRDLPGVTVALVDGRAWVRWDDEPAVLRAVLPVAGVELYVRRTDVWYRYGQHLPAFDFPNGVEYRPLARVLVPAAVDPLPAPRAVGNLVVVGLVPDTRMRPTTALRCDAAELARWAETVPATRLALIQAARCGERVLLVGTRLPALSGGERFWGTDVLVPLGQRAEPAWPAAAIREALGVGDGGLLLLSAAGAEVVPTAALRPLTRAQVKLL